MTTEVLIHIKTQQILKDRTEEEQNDVMEWMVGGEYSFRNGTHYLLYEETMEGFTETTKNLVKVRHNFMEIRRKGTVNVTMTFEKGKEHTALYKTPFGILEMEFDTKEVRVDAVGKCMEIYAEYVLGTNGAAMADCKMQMRIAFKGDTDGLDFFP